MKKTSAATAARLGGRYRDSITGFVGVATARAEYLFSTPQVRLEGETGQGDPKEYWIHEARLEEAPPKPPGFGR